MGEWRKEESFSDYTVLYDWILPRTSVTRKKSPNFYKSCLKMISLEK